MSQNCDTYITPVFQEDFCGGEKKDVKCVVDTNAYPELALSVNSTQEEFNQAVYTAFIAMKARLDSLENEVNNL